MQGTIVIHLYNRKHGIIYSAEASGAEKLLSKLVLITGALGLISISIYFLPWVGYWIDSQVSQYSISAKTIANTKVEGVKISDTSSYQPRFDSKLPSQNTIKIRSIGVSAEINEGLYDSVEDALKKGIWRAPDNGTPRERSEPVILAAHRFGYLAWSNLFRRENSFYNLPNLKMGDMVEIDWQQRKYIYEVFAEGKGDKIADIQTDLVLYTCESLTGPVRIFKYAKLLEI